MLHAVRTLFFAFALAGFSLAACAEDAITIRYIGGHPLPGKSSETVNLRITRFSSVPVTAAANQEVDRFFAEISAVLAANGVTGDWQLAIPDSPLIEITIEIGGKKLQLISCHTLLEQSGNYLVTAQGGRAVPDRQRAAVLARESETFRRHRIAFEKILRLTLEKARVRLSPSAPEKPRP